MFNLNTNYQKSYYNDCRIITLFMCMLYDYSLVYSFSVPINLNTKFWLSYLIV